MFTGQINIENTVTIIAIDSQPITIINISITIYNPTILTIDSHYHYKFNTNTCI